MWGACWSIQMMNLWESSLWKSSGSLYNDRLLVNLLGFHIWLANLGWCSMKLSFQELGTYRKKFISFKIIGYKI